jgi:hypothetical protein
MGDTNFLFDFSRNGVEKPARAVRRKSTQLNHVDANPCTSVHTRCPQVAAFAYPRGERDLRRYRQFSTRAIHKNDNDLWKTLLLRFESVFSRLPSPPTAKSPTRSQNRSIPLMRLVSCATPPEPLEDAPRTALLSDLTEGERWDGFWSSQSDGYYVRCTRTSGGTEWFKLADEPAVAQRKEQRVLALHANTRAQTRVSVVVAQSPGGRHMLVGGTRRTSR